MPYRARVGVLDEGRLLTPQVCPIFDKQFVPRVGDL